MNNSHLQAKLDLRRHFLKRYHPAGSRRVFDAFQAKGVIWRELQKEFALESYWGVDILPKPGRLKVDSARVLTQPGWVADVVDLDAYGSPWKHWAGVLAHARGPVTVFLTYGAGGVAGSFRGGISKHEARALGIPFKLPPMIRSALRPMVLPVMLAQALVRYQVREALEALPSTTARYFGIRLEPK